MKPFVALAALLTAAPTLPQDAPVDTSQSYNTPYSSAMPPIRYRGESAAITLFVYDVSGYCGEAPEGFTTLGCRRRLKTGEPVIILPHPCPAAEAGEFYALIACHEVGHVNGWGANHES